jgi:predicted RNase H-like HicB family nuclease
MTAQTYRIDARWSDEADVWIATSPDVPGLVVHGADSNELVHKLRIVIPGLTETGAEPEDRISIRFCNETQARREAKSTTRANQSCCLKSSHPRQATP